MVKIVDCVIFICYAEMLSCLLVKFYFSVLLLPYFYPIVHVVLL